MRLSVFGKAFFLVLTLVCGHVSQPLPASASETLLVAYDPDFKPFTFQNEFGAADGILINILKEVLKSGKLKYQLVPMPRKRIVIETNAGNVDISLPWRQISVPVDQHNMVGPITAERAPTRLWQATRNDKSWKSLDDLKGLTVGIRAGFTYAPDFEAMQDINRVLTYSNEEMVKMLVSGRFDVAISDETTLRHTIRSMGLDHKIKPVDGPPVDYADRYFAVPKKKETLAIRLEQLLSDYKKTKRYAALLSRHIN